MRNGAHGATETTIRARTVPLLVLAVTLAVCAALLSLPLSVPVGPLYWDVFIYYDAANRILTGQVPIIDFFAPVGPLGYYIVTGLTQVFPNGQPALLASWSVLIVSAPLMAIVAWDAGRRSLGVAIALVIPFLLFSLLPFNTRAFYPLPGSDAFGIYNRQSCQMLYVLLAGLLFVRDRRALVAVVALAMITMFFLKITGFAIGGLICAYAFLAGRLPFRAALVAGLVFLAALGAVELLTGLVSAYVDDILLLLGQNSGSLLSRLRESGSQNVDFVLLGLVLSIAFVWAMVVERDLYVDGGTSIVGRISGFFDQLPCWLGAMLFLGLLFEAQNTGSQAFIFLWPVLLAMLLAAQNLADRPALQGSILLLVAAIALPPVVGVTARATRTFAGGLNNPRVDGPNLKTIGAVNMREEVAVRAERMLKFYADHRATYDDFIAIDEYPTPLFYWDYHFQIGYLEAVNTAIDSIRAVEASRGVRFDTIMTLDFVNPFPWLMDRTAPRHISIGADPFRTVPAPGPEEAAAVAAADLVLEPTCPPNINTAKLHAIYAPALKDHKRIKLDACYDALVGPRLAATVSP